MRKIKVTVGGVTPLFIASLHGRRFKCHSRHMASRLPNSTRCRRVCDSAGQVRSISLALALVPDLCRPQLPELNVASRPNHIDLVCRRRPMRALPEAGGCTGDHFFSGLNTAWQASQDLFNFSSRPLRRFHRPRGPWRRVHCRGLKLLRKFVPLLALGRASSYRQGRVWRSRRSGPSWPH